MLHQMVKEFYLTYVAGRQGCAFAVTAVAILVC